MKMYQHSVEIKHILIHRRYYILEKRRSFWPESSSQKRSGSADQAQKQKVKEVLGNTEATKEQLDEATKPLNDIMMKIGQAIYSQPWAENQNSTWENNTDNKSDDDWVQDADVENDWDNKTRV